MNSNQDTLQLLRGFEVPHSLFANVYSDTIGIRADYMNWKFSLCLTNFLGQTGCNTVEVYRDARVTVIPRIVLFGVNNAVYRPYREIEFQVNATFPNCAAALRCLSVRATKISTTFSVVNPFVFSFCSIGSMPPRSSFYYDAISDTSLSLTDVSAHQH